MIFIMFIDMYLLLTFLAFSCIQCVDSFTDSYQNELGLLQIKGYNGIIENSVCSDFSSDYEHDYHMQSNYFHKNSSKVRPECESFVREFGVRSSNFIKCSVICARPFRFCEGCVVHYMKAKTVFKDIVQDDEKQGNCRRELLNSDRVQVISSIDRDIENIWKTADCDRCFSSVTEDENGTVTATLTPKTLEFLEAYQSFNNCIPATNRTDNQTVCDVCEEHYRKMNSLFNEFLNDPTSPQHVCMDIVDMMNYTRLLWGRTLDCRNVHYSFGSVIPVAGSFLLIPILFYVGLGVYGTKKIRKIMKQKRLPYSLSTSYGTLDSPNFTEETERQSQDSALAESHDSSIQPDNSDNNQPKDRTQLVNGDLQNIRQSS